MYRKKVKNRVFMKISHLINPNMYPNAFNQLPMLD